MDCSEVRQNIVASLAGEFSSQESDDLQRHLHACRACQQEWQHVAETWELLGEWPDRDPRPELSTQILSRIARERDRAASRVRDLVPVAGTALLLFVLFTFLFPFPFILDLCRQGLRALGIESGTPEGFAFFVVGALYGVLPLLLACQFFRQGIEGSMESKGALLALLFSVVAVPYAMIMCREFTLGVTATLTAGVLSGALGGAMGGLRLAHRYPIPAQ